MEDTREFVRKKLYGETVSVPETNVAEQQNNVVKANAIVTNEVVKK